MCSEELVDLIVESKLYGTRELGICINSLGGSSGLKPRDVI